VNSTQDSRLIVQQALGQLRSIYRSGYDYVKAGVKLSELVDETGLQDDLFEPLGTENSDRAKSERLMVVIDEINRKSRATLRMARAAGPATYAMRRKHLSPPYTTDWAALPKVR